MLKTSEITSLLGAATVLVVIVKFVTSLSVYMLPSRLRRYVHNSSAGDAPWAMVTGASDGIGRAFADELAERGFNVLLHGRNHDKLSLVITRLQEKHPKRAFRIWIADASLMACMNCVEAKEPQANTDGQDATLCLERVHEAVRGLHLTVLVNNAGSGPANPIYSPLSECSASRVISNVSLNALFPLHLTRILLPVLTSNAPSLIMNISSMTDQGFPLLVSYSASKQFLISLTRAVGLEMALQGKAGDVELLGIRVGRVTGVSVLGVKPSLFTPDARAMARAALNKAGRGHGIVVGYWSHALQNVGMWLLPMWLQDRVICSVMKGERDAELRGMKES
ncbi:hypothetical protein HIM_08793 [Hirsutella minnesotensis 3608]|uniref:Uncharacterized protein n=1 Tax=Hirsutella minnesotensis 3608 TaxID=1043627 RepID=A0A0F7ZY43_9HYPO|nr:hypothetical protein HIM_08793 [Hirsutella minnesotensis 3608]